MEQINTLFVSTMDIIPQKNPNFNDIYAIEKGKTYILAIKNSEDSNTFTITVEQIPETLTIDTI